VLSALTTRPLFRLLATEEPPPMHAASPAAGPTDRPHLPGEVLTRRAVTVITALIALAAFAFSFGNVTDLALWLSIPAYIAWLIGPMVDLSVIGLLIGIRHLSLAGFTDRQLRKPRRLLDFSGLLTLALNTSKSIATGHPGTALIDAVAPSLLIGWGATGPWLLRQIYTTDTTPVPVDIEDTDEPAAPSPYIPAEPIEADAETAVDVQAPERLAPTPPEVTAEPIEADAPPPDETRIARPATSTADASEWDELLTRARAVDTAHRRGHGGRPISRDNLRSALRIGRDKATLLHAELRAEAAAAIDAADHDTAPVTDRELIAA
jgi:hypothetical protein